MGRFILKIEQLGGTAVRPFSKLQNSACNIIESWEWALGMSVHNCKSRMQQYPAQNPNINIQILMVESTDATEVQAAVLNYGTILN